MTRSLAVYCLIVLQSLAALAWPAHASTTEDLQHRALHSVLALHTHEDAHHHHDHDAHLGHDHELQLSLPATTDLASDTLVADHHHHDFNLSFALLLHYPDSVASGQCIQNPRVLPAMHSAERRTHLRPPQA